MSGTDRDRAWGRALTLSFRKLATYCWRVLWWSSDLGGLTPVPDPKRPKNRDHAHYAERNSATSVGVDLVMPSVCVAMTMKNPVDDEVMKLPQ